MTESESHSRFIFEPGDLIGDRYEVMRTLGEAGRTQVYRVRDRSLDDNRVALKLLVPQGPHRLEFEERLKNEVVLLRRLGHPNIVRVYEYGTLVRHGTFLTMEFVEGKLLCDHADGFPNARVPIPDVIRIMKQISGAVEYAHSQQIIHRDLKPENIFVQSHEQVKLVDFGAAKLLSSPKRITRRGVILGTPGYMAPEQVAGENVDARTDIFSLGLICYELLTGVPPNSEGPTFTTTFLSSKTEFARLNNSPLWLRDLIQTCTETQPKSRFQTMGEVRKILEDNSPT